MCGVDTEFAVSDTPDNKRLRQVGYSTRANRANSSR